MASQSLYRKWRSQTFGEIVGQQRVTRTLRNALRTGRLSHAYLFCGPRGVGKTSAARVLAKAVNCHNSQDGEPCNDCPACRSITEGRCMDVIEIDAASNRGIDEIRDLRDKVNFAPSEVSYKFYILDEVHMLTTEAFNALLKTLEEPPEHAVFVLVTTESHRLPATIVSRCQRLDFQRIALPDLVGRMSLICAAEGIAVDAQGLELIARLSTGSLRDAESLLDQLVSYCGETIALADIHMVVGMTGTGVAKELVAQLVVGDVPAGLRAINSVAGEGTDLRQLCREVVEYLRGLLVLKVGGGVDLLDVTGETLQEMEALVSRVSADFLVKAIRLFANAEVSQRTSSHVQLPLELAFVEATLAPPDRRGLEDRVGLPSQPTPAGSPSARPSTVSRPVPDAVPTWRAARPPESSARTEAVARPGAVPVAKELPAAVPAPSEEAANLAAPNRSLDAKASGHGLAAPVSPANDAIQEPSGMSATSAAPAVEDASSVLSASDASALSQIWTRAIERCGQVNRMVQALLRDCELVKIEDGVAHVEAASEFHRGRIGDEKSSAVVTSILGEIVGAPIRVSVALRPQGKKKSAEWPMDDPLVKAAIEQHGARIKKVETTRGTGG